jgi:hypothetical protein
MPRLFRGLAEGQASSAELKLPGYLSPARNNDMDTALVARSCMPTGSSGWGTAKTLAVRAR